MSHLSLCVFLQDPGNQASDGVSAHVPELEAGEAGALLSQQLWHCGELSALAAQSHAVILNTKL